MKLGKAWILTEVFFHTDRRVLVSILSSRRSASFVRDYLEQTYVDRHASVEEKLAYKKRARSWSYQVTQVDSRYAGVMVCGHEPAIWACYCHNLQLADGMLAYKFKTLQHVDEHLRPTFREVTESVAVTNEDRNI